MLHTLAANYCRFYLDLEAIERSTFTYVLTSLEYQADLSVIVWKMSCFVCNNLKMFTQAWCDNLWIWSLVFLVRFTTFSCSKSIFCNILLSKFSLSYTDSYMIVTVNPVDFKNINCLLEISLQKKETCSVKKMNWIY